MRRLHRNERGQILPIMALLVVVFIGLIGIAVDVGHLFVARTELARAMDAAALAGVIELPNMTNAQNRATAYLHDNQPDASATFPVASQFQFKVKGTRSVRALLHGHLRLRQRHGRGAGHGRLRHRAGGRIPDAGRDGKHALRLQRGGNDNWRRLPDQGGAGRSQLASSTRSSAPGRRTA